MEPEFTCRVFGLTLRANRPIPNLKFASLPGEKPDVAIHFKSAPAPSRGDHSTPETLYFTSSYRLESGEPTLRIWRVGEGALWRMDYADGMQFWLDGSGKEVWAQWPATLTIEDAATYLLGPVFGFLLRVRGITCLHASAVAFGKTAAIFAGEPGAGKSTTAAALAKRGHALVSDDIVALEDCGNTFLVLPAYPYISLWADSVSALFGAADALPSFSGQFDKRRLDVSATALQFAGEPLPLAAIFLLGERTDDRAAPYLEPLAPRESLISLVTNSYAGVLLNEERRAREFSLLGRIAGAVPMMRLRAHRDPARIDRLCEFVEQALENPSITPHELPARATSSATK